MQPHLKRLRTIGGGGGGGGGVDDIVVLISFVCGCGCGWPWNVDSAFKLLGAGVGAVDRRGQVGPTERTGKIDEYGRSSWVMVKVFNCVVGFALPPSQQRGHLNIVMRRD